MRAAIAAALAREHRGFRTGREDGLRQAANFTAIKTFSAKITS
jgi:hypothetical protein